MLDGIVIASIVPMELLNVLELPALFSVEVLQKYLTWVCPPFLGDVLKEEENLELVNSDCEAGLGEPGE